MLQADTSIKYVKGVGEARAKLFAKLGVETVSDLVHLYPRQYKDFSNIFSIADAPLGESCIIRAIVDHSPVEHRIRKGMTLYKTVATDGHDIVHLTFFNNPYITKTLQEGQEYLFCGKITMSYGSYEMSSPTVEPLSSIGKLRPVYPQTAGLTSKTIERVMTNALTVYAPDYDIIPKSIREEYKLCSLGYALHNVHFPENRNDMEIARRRLMFEELLVLQLGMGKLRERNRGYTPYKLRECYSETFEQMLPFKMTGAQVNAVADCIRDMGLNEPMNRLLQGDVGSGKTCVAASVIFSAKQNGMQCALMVPTGVLAAQHYETMCKFFGKTDMEIALLTGSTKAKEKEEIKRRVKNGEIDLLIGTHAIIQDNVEFSRLGLVITDEQHRFGVKQRMTLKDKGNNPHTLVMSATPIPRTLALIVYGDLDISVLDELPPGRQKIDTYVVDESYHERVYNFIKKHLDQGLQAYIVCPLVEESEAVELTSATEYAEKLKNESFRDYSVGLLHGKMKPKDKEKIMSDFASGRVQLLVSTTVIEVGVDVPDAVVMVIENAERFGLSQLHQLRGRVGRGKNKSTCILISDSAGENSKKRLETMRKSNNGFVIAEEDLKLRGPGDFFGQKQHGLPEMRIADMLDDVVLCNQSREAAKEILSTDPQLEKEENRALNREVQLLFRDTTYTSD